MEQNIVIFRALLNALKLEKAPIQLGHDTYLKKYVSIFVGIVPDRTLSNIKKFAIMYYKYNCGKVPHTITLEQLNAQRERAGC